MKPSRLFCFNVMSLFLGGSLLAQLPVRDNSQKTNEPLNQVMEFKVVDAENGKPLEGAKLSVPFFYEGGESENVTNFSDSEGRVFLFRPKRPGFRGFNAFVSQEGYVGKVINVQTAKGIPNEYVFRLNRGVTIGGIVKNESGHLIEGVEIKLMTPGISSDDPEHIHYHGQKIETDKKGQWSTSRISSNIFEVRLHFVHTEYKRLSATININDSHETVFVLEKGHNINGKVIGWDNHPIEGATVREYHNRGSNEPKLTTQTDHEGKFTIENVTEGVMEIVVEAEGNAPVLKEVLVVPNMEPVLFILEKGGIFRGRVTDEKGLPIANARVLTDSDNQGRRPVFWITTTDNEGQFLWKSAPTAPTLFWFEATGYDVIRDKLLSTDGTAHEIVLKKQSNE